MIALRPIEIERFRRALGRMPAAEMSDAPTLEWLKIERLGVDPIYQREIGRRGESNVLQIARWFDWSKFSPVIVAPVGGGGFAIIDGQHRVTAAAARGITKVPCQIINIDQARQAEAFAAINGNVTAMTPLQMHAARLAGGDEDAGRLAKVCAAADVTVCRYPVPASKMTVGQTLAVGVLARLLRRYGDAVLVAALSCITKTRKGNPGMVRAPVVAALCSVFEAEPDWCADGERLIKAMQRFDFAAAFTAAGQKSYAERCSMASALVDAIAEHLEKHWGGGK